jgi:hypothetical protein
LTIAVTREYSLIVATSEKKSDELDFIDRQITRAFRGLVDSEFRRLGIDPLPSVYFSEGASPRLRFSPMKRLLLAENHFLSRARLPETAVRALHRAHFACYRDYLNELRREVRRARRSDAVTMQLDGRWQFPPILRRLLLSESSLIYLEWLGWKFRFGLNVNIALTDELLEYLLTDALSQPEATSPA